MVCNCINRSNDNEICWWLGTAAGGVSDYLSVHCRAHAGRMVVKMSDIEKIVEYKLKVKLPGNINQAIEEAVFDTFAEARKKAYSSNFPLYLTKKQVCEYLNISNRTLNDWIEKEDIPFKHIGKTYRFNRNELDKFMATK